MKNKLTLISVKSPPSGCGGDQILTIDSNYKNATHNIKSKSWPQKYNDKQPSQCMWAISMDPAMRQQGIKMVFEFTQFQLEKNRDLVCNADDTDKLIIYGATSCEEWFINVRLMYFFADASATGSEPQN